MKTIVLLLGILAILTGCTMASTSKTDNNTKRIALTYDDAPRNDGRVFSGVERTEVFIKQLEEAETGP